MNKNNLLSLMFIILIAMGCSSDDSFNTDSALYINKSDLYPYPYPYLTNIYYDNNKNICISYYWADLKTGTSTYACEGTCPIDHESKKEIYVAAEPKKDSPYYENPYFRCSGCGSKFDINNGKCKEGKAKGYSLKIYKAKSIFDGYKFIGVYIWK